MKRTPYVVSLFALTFALPPGSSLHAQASPPQQKQTVVVTGVYEPIPLAEADRSVSVIDVKTQMPLANSLLDFLRLDSSVDLQERAPDGMQADVSIRGATFGQALVLLDGWRMNDSQSGHHNLDIPIPLEAVTEVQILHGSGSTLYGSDAVGGVVNFVPVRPEATELRLRTAVGSFGINEQSATLGTALRRMDGQVNFSRQFSTGFRPDRDYRNLTFDSLAHFDSSLGTTEVLLAHNDRPFGADRFYGNFNSWERTRTWFAGVRQGVGKRDQLSFAFRRHTDLFVLFRDRPQIYTNRHFVKGYQAAWRHHQQVFRDGRVYGGLEGYSDSIHSNNLGDHSRRRGAGYLALDVRALRRFSFTLGAREETYSSLQGEFSPSASGGFWIRHNLKLRAAVTHAFRLPTFTDLYYHDPATLGSPGLKPERAWNYETGLDWYGGSRFESQFTLFERQDRNGIDYVKTSPEDLWRATNIGNLTFRGAEISVRTSLAPSQQLEFSYAALRGSNSPLGIVESRYLFNYLAHSADFSWHAVLPGGLVARSRVGVVDRIHRSPYALWDLALARTKGRLHPFLQISNLTDTAYEEIRGVPMPGRAVIAGVDVLLLSRKR